VLFLVIAFVVVPIIELALIIEVGSRIGVLETIVLVVGISVVGAWLAKREGFAVVRRFRVTVAAGRIPDRELVDGLLVLAGGLLLLTPGFLTDGAGLLLLAPPSRTVARRAIRRHLRIDVVGGHRAAGPDAPYDPYGNDVIDI
jgi:UPF0716 protein FxsA